MKSVNSDKKSKTVQSENSIELKSLAKTGQNWFSVCSLSDLKVFALFRTNHHN